MLNVERNGRDSARVEIHLVNGQVIYADEKRVMSDGIKIEDTASESSNFSIGFVSCKVLTLQLMNYDQNYNTNNCTGATVIPYIINNGREYKKGQYKVYSSKYDNGLLNLTCYDNVRELDKSIDASKFTLPCTYAQALKTAVESCGLTLANTKFTNYDLMVLSRLS